MLCQVRDKITIHFVTIFDGIYRTHVQQQIKKIYLNNSPRSEIEAFEFEY